MRPAGIGLRAPHGAELLRRKPPVGFVEVHSENHFGDGPALEALERVRRDYPVSLHGVGLSLGSADPLDERHLASLAALAALVQPMLVSEHLCWSSIDGVHANDLLPLPFTAECVTHLSARIGRVQDRLGRELLLENVSSYHAFAESTLAEWEFVAEVARTSGCRLLLDLNNVFVNARNFGFDARRYLAAMPADLVAQYHLGGHASHGELLVDDHGCEVCPEVWALYREALRSIGPRPTLVEWDTRLPSLGVLLAQAGRADAIARECRRAGEALAT